MAKNVNPPKSGSKPAKEPKPSKREEKRKLKARSVGNADRNNYNISVHFHSGGKRHISSHKTFKPAREKFTKLVASCAAIDQVRITSRNTGIHVGRNGMMRGG
jgi:hypothetical protein